MPVIKQVQHYNHGGTVYKKDSFKEGNIWDNIFYNPEDNQEKNYIQWQNEEFQLLVFFLSV